MPVKKLDLDLLPQLRSVEIRAKRKVLARVLEGSWTALLKGRGMEFAGFRKYNYGDDASRIDWGASLRSKDTLIREFEEYKNVNVIFVMDVSDTMLFTSQKKLKAEYAAEMSFTVASAILDNGDAIGHLLFSDRIMAKSMPSIGKQAIFAMASSLSNPALYGGKKDFRNMLLSLNILLKQRALIVLVSDFLGLEEGWERYIRMLSEMVRDPRDRALPVLREQFLLEDPASGEHLYVDLKDYAQSYNVLMQKEEQYIKNVFTTAHAGFVLLNTDEDMVRPVTEYFKQRSKLIKG
jgi:uncharacterized protein (DUF58 family)